MFALLEAGILAALTLGAVLAWYLWQRGDGARRIGRAILADDYEELCALLAERAELHSVARYYGDPALILAIDSAGPCLQILRLLLVHGARVNERGAEWKTALMHAASAGRREICELLLAHGAEANAGDLFGRTAADWAERQGHRDLAQFLRREIVS